MQHPGELMASEEYQLDRQATACKRAGDWDGAIAALRKRKALLGVTWNDAKLAKYLQQAGRFDEAMAEMQWLMDHAQAWAVNNFSHRPATVLQRQRTGYLARLHSDAALICKRQKRPDLQATHEQQRDAYGALHEKLRPLADADMRRLSEQWEQALKAPTPARRLEAMQALHEQREELMARNRGEA